MTLFFKQKFTFFLLLSFLVVCNSTTINAQTTDKVIPGGKLSWKDFTGRPESNSPYWATTYWYVHYEYSVFQTSGDTVKADLQVWPALKANSWVLENKKSDELLQHEQGHFNFAVLLTLQFKKAAGSALLRKNDCAQKLDSIFHSILNNIRQMEIQYDTETNHMQNKTEQARWNKKINEMIRAAE